MKETGRVIKAEGDMLTVRFERKTECEKCKMCMFSKNMSYFDLKFKNTVNAQEGDTVIVSMKGGAVVLSSLLVYIIPLIFSALGIVLGYLMSGETLALILCAVFLAAGFLFVFVLDKYLKRKNKIGMPHLTGIMNKQTEKGNNQ